jgi:beta-glucosidase
LKKAAADKIISEEQIDTALKRLFMARFKLGMFDPDNEVKYAQIPYSTVDSKEHRQLALDAARKSMVLLKNDKNTLPMKKDIGTIAVIGPNADQWLMLLGNYNGVPADPVTPLRGIREKVLSNTKVLYAQGSPLADGMPLFETVPADVLTSDGKPGLTVEYFNDHEIDNKRPLYSESSPALDANWKNKSPREDLDDDNFAVRWTGEITPKETGTYQLGVITTCNTKLFMGDTVIAKTAYHFRDEYGDPRLRKSVSIKLEAGKSYKFKVEAAETYADAQVQLVWDLLGSDEITKLKKEAIDVAKKAEVVVMFMGLTARLEGEEMDVAIEGFRGGDRTTIDLPKVQQDLIKEIHALGKPVVLVLLNGSALAINWEARNIPAIVEAWYPGQAAGTAIADVLFGDYNPGGKLPVTFYKSVNDLPSFEDYHMKGRTYRYFQGEPLYPFGHGLSYTSFDYTDLRVDGKIVSVNVTNTGKVDGEEVVQVYASGTLAAFKRIILKAGEAKDVQLEMKNIKPGTYSISVGGGQKRFTKTLAASTSF